MEQPRHLDGADENEHCAERHECDARAPLALLGRRAPLRADHGDATASAPGVVGTAVVVAPVVVGATGGA